MHVGARLLVQLKLGLEIILVKLGVIWIIRNLTIW